MPLLELTNNEIDLLKYALDETMDVLKRRFYNYEEEYVQPYLKYQDLYDKLKTFDDNLLESRYFLIALEKPL